ncbi:hypothetical protein Tco_0241305 [Tanacetum coccineum]
MKHLISLTNPCNIRLRHTHVSIVEGALIRALIVKQGTYSSLIRVPVTIKILVMTNLHFIHLVCHNSSTVVRSVEVHIIVMIANNNSLTVVRSVEVPIIALIVQPGTSLENNHIFEELFRTLKTNSPVGEPEGSNDFTEVPFNDEQILRQHNTTHVTPPPLAYTPTPLVLATIGPLDTFLMGDEVISTILERENDEFIKSSVDDLVPIPKESELTLDSTNLECSIPIDPPLPYTDVLGDTIVDRDLLLGEHLDTLSIGDREIDFNPIRYIEELERLLVDDPVPVPRVFDAPLGHSDSISRSFDVTFSNSLFDFNDDYNLCYDNPLFNKEFEDISSLDTLESTLVINESTIIVTPLSASKPFSLREAERFDSFFLPDTVGWEDESDGDPFF